MMTRTLFGFAVCAGIILTLGACGQRIRSDLSDQLRGSWHCVDLWEGGKQAAKAERLETTLHIRDDKIVARICGETVTANYLIVSNSFPTAMDLIFSADGIQRRVRAIVEIKGMTLRICHPEGKRGKRPPKFEATKETVLAVFRKDSD